MGRCRRLASSGAPTPSAATEALAPEEFRTYQLLIRVSRPVQVTVGRFGTFDFPAGWYVYTGSARRNFEARVRRHLSPHKTLRWHIDYLLAAPGVAIRDVRRTTEAECALNQQLAGVLIVAGFGASDCRAGCVSHLKRLASRRVFSLFRR